jgi:murein DD-endopeptidase MepM/ murein hydrolase activator NlpD
LDHGSARSTHRWRGERGPFDLGHEPPLSVDGEASAVIPRRRVSVQWLSGTILTGICGAALMGGAVFASLDGETNFATLPERVELALRGAIGSERHAHGTRKADRLPTAAESNVSRHLIRVSTMTRVGSREVVRVRPLVRITGNLSLSLSELSAQIPPFNAQRLIAEAATEEVGLAESAPAAAPDAEVSFVTRELGEFLPRAKLANFASPEEIIASVQSAANVSHAASAPFVTATAPAQVRLAYAAEGNPDPYAGFEARIVPQNVTLLPKTTTQATGGSAWNERTVAVRKGDTIQSILSETGATPEEVNAIAAALGARGRPAALKDGDKLRILLAPAKGQRLQPVRVIVGNDQAVEAVVALSDIGKYVSVDVQSVETDVAEASSDAEDTTAVRLYQSIYETSLRNQVPRPAIDDLIRIYSYDVDFQRKVQPGDSFELLFAGEDEAPGIESKSEVLFTSLTIGGETRRFYRYQTPDDGVVDYYDETGKSAKKFLIRKPLMEGVLRSGFGFRRHPILGYTKMHSGIDWTAPHGTQVYAAGNGIVEKAGWESGYGRYIRVRHANGYETAYAHLSAFARGIEPGARVRQGQVIGFVGSTGLSIGAHLHYEILVNSRFVDPMRIRLPRGRALEGPILAAFEQERDRLDSLMTRAPSRMAQSGFSFGR